MKILVISHESELNGASLSLLGIIDCLSQRHQFFVVTSSDSGPFVDELKKRKQSVITLPYTRWMQTKGNPLKWIIRAARWNLVDSLKNQKTAKKLAEFIKENDIDLIYSNTRVVDIGMRVTKLTKKPHIWHFREFGEEDFNMHPLCLKSCHYKKIGDNTDYIICNSKAVYNKFADKIKGKAKLSVVYNGITPPKEINNHENEKLRFLITGRVSEAKGQLDAVLAVKELISRGYSDFELLVAGPKNSAYPGLDNESVPSNVTFLGKRDDMQYLRSVTDVELVCSKMEAFGRVTVEAMMSGNAVIGKNSGGTAELIIENENGFLYEPYDISSLADKMEYFINNPDAVKAMGKNAYNYAKERFLIEKCALSVEEIFIRAYEG